VLDSQETQIDNSETQDWSEIVYDVSSSESASVGTDLPTNAVTSTLRRSGRSSVIARRHFYLETSGSTFDLNAIPVHCLGEMNSSCDHCGALYFECEKNQQGLSFKCCRNGKVPDPSIPQPPVLIRNLIKHHPSFVPNIIYYNNAFAFASIGVSFKSLPNKGHTAIIINGQITNRLDITFHIRSDSFP